MNKQLEGVYAVDVKILNPMLRARHGAECTFYRTPYGNTIWQAEDFDGDTWLFPVHKILDKSFMTIIKKYI